MNATNYTNLANNVCHNLHEKKQGMCYTIYNNKATNVYHNLRELSEECFPQST